MPKLCTGCEACVKVCPNQTISMQDGKAVVSGDRSLNCGHCMAVCPVDAVRVEAIDPESLQFNGFKIKAQWMAHGEFDTQELVRLMASRRSCRNFTDRPVEPDTLQDLIKIRRPGTVWNQQPALDVFRAAFQIGCHGSGNGLAGFFGRLNKMAAKPMVRSGLKLIGKPQLSDYYRDYYESVEEGLQGLGTSTAVTVSFTGPRLRSSSGP